MGRHHYGSGPCFVSPSLHPLAAYNVKMSPVFPEVILYQGDNIFLLCYYSRLCFTWFNI